jgi:hypothetical protein
MEPAGLECRVFAQAVAVTKPTQEKFFRLSGECPLAFFYNL